MKPAAALARVALFVVFAVAIASDVVARTYLSYDCPHSDPAWEEITCYEKKAKQGDINAMRVLGFSYGHMAHWPTNYKASVYWIRRAAERGSVEAMYELGRIYETSGAQDRYEKDFPKDMKKAMKWYRLAAEHGYEDAIRIVEAADRREREKKKAELEKLTFEADLGNVEAQYELGNRYANGKDIEEDHAEALKWFRDAAEQGHVKSAYRIGDWYERGIKSVEQDYAEAAKWYRLAAEQGYAKAQRFLGLMYADGRGVEQDYAEAAKWYRAAAEQGHGYAQYKLGTMHNRGYGVPLDTKEALKWLRLAAKNVGSYSDDSKTISGSIAESLAVVEIGLMYYFGHGVPQNKDRAVRFLNRGKEMISNGLVGHFFDTSNSGKAVFYYVAGVFSSLGEGGFERSNEQAAKMYKEAANLFSAEANQGDVFAQYILGLMHSKGEGVAQKHNVAMEWYRLAAAQGHPESKDLLAEEEAKAEAKKKE